MARDLVHNRYSGTKLLAIGTLQASLADRLDSGMLNYGDTNHVKRLTIDPLSH